MVFWYNGDSGVDGDSYDIYPRKATEAQGGCDYDLYDSGSSLTGLTFVDSYVVKVDKEEVEEPDVFLDGNIAGVLQRVGEAMM